MQKFIIWSDENVNYEDYKEYYDEEYPDMTEEERIDNMYELNNIYLDDERMNLDIRLSQPILVVADLGLWNGRFSGFKEIESGNISDCLYGGQDYNTWYIDEKGDLCADCTHHDGTNHYVYRVYKDNTTAEQRENLKLKIYNGTATRKDITRLTKRLGDDVAKVYGWKIYRGKGVK